MKKKSGKPKTGAFETTKPYLDTLYKKLLERFEDVLMQRDRKEKEILLKKLHEITKGRDIILKNYSHKELSRIRQRFL